MKSGISLSNEPVLISGTRKMTAENLEDSARRAAAVLKADGVKAGDVVAILMRNDFHYFVLAEAVRFIGAGLTPINWHLKPSEVAYILADCKATTLIAHADLISHEMRAHLSIERLYVEPVPPEISVAYKIEKDDDTNFMQQEISLTQRMSEVVPLEEDIGPPVPALFYTSGTTGYPKAVVRKKISPEAAQALAQRSALAFGLSSPPVTALMTGPLYHSAPNAYALYVVRRGGCLVLQPRFNANQFLLDVETFRITHVHMVPIMFQRILALPDSEIFKYDTSSLQHIVHGAAPCPENIKAAMIERFGPIINEYYAMTELGIIAFSDSAGWLANRGTVGRPPQGVSIQIRGEDGSICEMGQAGNICVRHEATNSFTYHGADQKADDMRADEHVITGDIGFVNENGYLFISDRKTDMIISGGVNIYPAEIEAVLAYITGVRDCAVFGVPDDIYGESVVAVIEPVDGADLDSIRKELAKKIAGFKMPRNFQLVEKMPREDSGKIKKRILRDNYLAEVSSSEERAS